MRKRLILTDEFLQWFDELSDLRARAKIQARLDRLELGNFGDVKPVGAGVSELRIDFGPGYRIYCSKRDMDVIVVVSGGDKSTQRQDIEAAISIAKNC